MADSTTSLEHLKESFERFMADPVEAFRIRLRRHRAEQIRKLLSDPDKVDLDAFNHEVWEFESATLLDGQSIKGEIFGEGLTPERAAELEQAMDTGRLELHGNYIWGSGARVYGSRLEVSPEEKVENLRRAVGILGDSALRPLAQAERLQEVPGLGPNSATGLVMVFRPAEFAIYNTESEKALKSLGRDYTSLASFQDTIRDLREKLGAEDYMELDWFLYQRNRAPRPTGYWWVNQGVSYQTECREGCMWASKVNKDGRVIGHWANLADAKPGDIVIHYVSGQVLSVSRVKEAAVDARRPGAPPEETWDGYLVRTEYFDLPRPISRTEMPADWKARETSAFDKNGNPKMGYFFPLSEGFVREFVERFSDRLPSFLKAAPSAWIFQANPAMWDPAKELPKYKVGDIDDWRVNQHRGDIHAGDTMVLWISGSNGGIRALGELIGEPSERELPPLDNENAAKRGWAVDFRYTRILDRPISRDIVRSHPVLQNMAIFRNPVGTNFVVTPDEWSAIKELVGIMPEGMSYWKIAPGEGAWQWDDCRDQGFIAVGWEKMPDLATMTAQEFDARLQEVSKDNPEYAYTKAGASYLWQFAKAIKKGDKIVANQGMSKVLGIGTVTGPYYYAKGSTFPHRLPVRWDDTEPRSVSVRHSWMKTLVKLTKEEFDSIVDPIPQVAPEIARIRDILDRKGQVILYGPPGTGKTYWALRAAEALAGGSETVEMCTFHPSYGYEDFLEGYRPDPICADGGPGQLAFRLKDGIFKELCAKAKDDPGREYYLIIDEINRGDIPRIFGELLTLLEMSKRETHSVKLPLSGEDFFVPANLRVIGTMNTADRSIALLDTALRRRFGFIELMPSPEVLGDRQVEGIRLSEWLEALNRRVRKEAGRDARNRQIGHSYLMNGSGAISSFEEFARAVREDLLPLLEEYCYEDYATLERLLGRKLVDSGRQRFREELFEPGCKAELVAALKEIIASAPVASEALVESAGDGQGVPVAEGAS